MFVAALDATTRQQAGVGAGVVIPSVLVLGLDFRRATEFCRYHDQCVLEFSAFVEVGDQRGVGLVELFAASFDSGEVVVVGVPTTELHFYKTHTVFHETTRKQTALGETAGAVEFFRGFGFLVQVEGFEILRIHQSDRFLIKILIGLNIRVGITPMELFVEFIGEG